MAHSCSSGLDDSDFYGSASSSDDDLPNVDQHQLMMFVCTLAAQSSMDGGYSFFGNEWMDGGYSFVDKNVGLRLDVLAVLRATPILFMTLTNFSVAEFDELCATVGPSLSTHACHTGQQKLLLGRPPKLSPPQRILNFLLYMKHDNTNTYDGFWWNWSKSCLCDDTLFVASCICEALEMEIRWPSAEERLELGNFLPQLPGCIGVVDGTLVRIRRPWKHPQHGSWYNGRKKIYCINNIVIIVHHGLFILVESGFPASFHDINTLRHTEFHKTWRAHFTHDDNHFEYVLGNPAYQGGDMYIMRHVGTRELHADADLSTVRAFNKMHVGYRVRVEWGIGGLKRKWRRLSKVFECTRVKFSILFHSAALLTNFLHRRRLDYSVEILGDPNRLVIDGAGTWEDDEQ
jgi:hypothetical protein